MAKPRAFISFEMEDKWARDFLVQQAKDKNNDIEFSDYSVKDPFDSKWKTECKKRIVLTKGTIVLTGKTTSKSEAVLWEIAETIRQDHYMFGIPDQQGQNPHRSKRLAEQERDPLGLRTDREMAEDMGIGCHVPSRHCHTDSISHPR
jgi:hypothetical protein